MESFAEQGSTDRDKIDACGETTAIVAPPFIKITDAVVKRQGKTLLSVDSFQLDEGENIAILGPNGAGKSTFVKLMTRHFTDGFILEMRF